MDGVLFRMNFYKDKKVLVTGATGLVGTNLVNALKKEGAMVREASFSKENTDLKYNVDLREIDSCEIECKDIDYVFHCAAASFGAKVMKEDPMLLVSDNIRINLNMLEAASKAGVKRFLFVSSSTVYPDTPYPVREQNKFGQYFDEDVFEGYFGVGNMKRISETMCRIFHKYTNMDIAIVRPVNMYGPHDKFGEGSHVLPALIKRAIDKEDPYVVWGEGKAVRDFMYIDDAVEMMMLVLERRCTCNPINIGTGEELTIRKTVGVILNQLPQFKPVVEFDETKPEAIQYRMLDLSKQKELGFEPKVSFEEGIRRTIEWYKKQ